MPAVDQPKCLWKPGEKEIADSNLFAYLSWISTQKKLNLTTYDELWNWSVQHLEDFWESILSYFEVQYDGHYSRVIEGVMPKVSWFQGLKLNYAEHIFRNKTTAYPAIVYKTEGAEAQELSWDDLEQNVAALQTYLRKIGIKEGDCVAAYLPNTPEAIISFLAVSSLGAVWTSTSPDFGTKSVIDRITQIKPKLLIAVNQYQYGGKTFNKQETLTEILTAIPSIKDLILIGDLDDLKRNHNINITPWSDALSLTSVSLKFNRVDFSAPIWVLYSSGTTGMPKAITHSQGGVLLEHLKYLSLHGNVKPGERCFWFTTTGWMMWNYIQASLLCGGTVVLYDGSPAYPDINTLWQFAEEVKINHFGTSAGFIIANIKAATHPGSDYDLSSLKSIGSTGSPLPPEGFDWIYNEVKKDLWLTSISGGSDVCSAFVGGNPMLPVYSGEIQCRALGCSLEAFDAKGKPLRNEMGEMVITQPMPSMPIYFWGDKQNEKYLESYFSMYPGIWRHGDWTEITSRNGIIIYGRSDSTLNRGGIRIGTAEIYRAVDAIDAIEDSLVVYLDKGSDGIMPLFVKLKTGKVLTEELIGVIKTAIRQAFTPRHVPDQIIAVNDIPYTISGKKMETPVKKILMGQPINTVTNPDAMRNPAALDDFISFRQSGIKST